MAKHDGLLPNQNGGGRRKTPRRRKTRRKQRGGIGRIPIWNRPYVERFGSKLNDLLEYSAFQNAKRRIAGSHLANMAYDRARYLARDSPLRADNTLKGSFYPHQKWALLGLGGVAAGGLAGLGFKKWRERNREGRR